MTHPWHDVPLSESADRTFAAVVETPRDSHVQYALDLATGLLRVRRILFGAFHFPVNYGFAPRTMGHDDEPLDVLLIGQKGIAPLTMMRARAVGHLWVEEAGQRDDKVIAVHADDPVFTPYQNMADLPGYLRAQIERFFDDYRSLEGATVTACGLAGPEDALALLDRASDRYQGVHGSAPAAMPR
ncbi:MAG: inorganic diphosphatase [Polyangiaceae bacterium]|nr:inorganic diphosphatase [Polyangiaceae bacterium]